MRTIFINGKFVAQATTGVQRVAWQIVLALDRLLDDSPKAEVRWILLCPRGSVAPVLRNVETREIGSARLPLHLWEQVVLPCAARGAMLLNLAGAAPLLKRLQACTFHDAAVFDCPDGYTWAFRTWYRALFRHTSRSARVVLTVSNFSRQRLMIRLGLPASRFAVMHGSGEHMRAVLADDGALARAGLEQGRFFIAVGSANPTKNHAAMIAAFESLPSECDARLVIVGGANEAVFGPESGASHGGTRVVHAGRLPDTELKALYGAALGLLFPSRYEGFGLPLLEAMACGCPILASNAASIPEVCGDAALYFDPRSQAEMKAAILRFSNDEALRDTLRARGSLRAQKFSWSGAARVALAQLCGEVSTGPAVR